MGETIPAIPWASTREFSLPTVPCPSRCALILLVLYSTLTLPGGTFVGGGDRLAREFCSGESIRPSTAAMIRILRTSGGIVVVSSYGGVYRWTLVLIYTRRKEMGVFPRDEITMR